MNTWHHHLITTGFNVQKIGDHEFRLIEQPYDNLLYLEELLQASGADYELKWDRLLIAPICPPMSMERWLSVLMAHGQRNSELLMPQDRMEIRSLDVHMAGLITQLNRLGFPTNVSCSGHGDRYPKIGFTASADRNKLRTLFAFLGISVMPPDRGIAVLHCNPERLPQGALRLAQLTPEDLDDLSQSQRKHREALLETLLSIPGSSGNEGEIRDFLYEELKPRVDRLTVDSYGNLMAYKKYGRRGPTILLSAHMDIHSELIPGSCLIKEKDIWTRDRGILGADDRAGIAMILLMIEELEVSDFRGAIKIIFTVEEESGLQGARHVEPKFLWDVDAAIMLDRRNGGDLVTHYGDIPYASEEYGRYFETIAQEIGLGDVYKTCGGGSSDLKIWAAHGVDSINISVGFHNEHRSGEYLDIQEWERTLALVLRGITNLHRLAGLKHQRRRRWG